MKKLAIVFALTPFCLFGELKIGTVDLLTLVRNHPNYESNRNLLKDTEKDYQKKLDVIKADLDKIQEEGRKLAEQQRNPMFAAAAKEKMEKELLERMNGLGIGPGGLGGTQTVLAVHVNTYATHIAGLPVAVNICCHVNRHAIREI